LRTVERLLLRVSEAADLLGIGRTMAYDLVRTGDIPSIQLGSRIRVPRAELETKIAARVAEAVEERARVLAAYRKTKA
jgi:excisionase family DNA binding protein